MNAMNWTYALDDAALLEGHMAPAYPLGVNIVLARVGGAVYAVSGKCAHMACPLFMGKLAGYTITCPCHDWRFDVRTGKFLDAPELGLPVYPTKSEAGRLLVNLGWKEAVMKKVRMYTLSTCPWCRKTKKFFADHKVPFDYIDYDLADEANQKRIMQEIDAAGASGFPFVRIDDEVIVGYQPERYSSALGI